jgi:4a-hydroxytetrahydrobiopterin dehydratase
MPGMDALTEQQITEALGTLPGWEYDGEAISKTYALSSFRDAVDFVNDIADLAEDENHHPDLEIYYDEVVVSFRTHSADAVTDADVRMAAEVEALAAEADDPFDDDFDDEYDDLEDLDDEE